VVVVVTCSCLTDGQRHAIVDYVLIIGYCSRDHHHSREYMHVTARCMLICTEMHRVILHYTEPKIVCFPTQNVQKENGKCVVRI